MSEFEVTAARNFLTVVKVLNFIDGVKFCYFFCNLGFDWRLVYRKPSLTWTGIVYLACRFMSVACVVSFMVGLDTSSEINCQAWVTTAFVFPLLELELSLVLIIIRVVAIWKRSNLVICLSAIILSLHSGATLHLLTKIRAFWDPGPQYKGCILYSPRLYLISMSIATIAAYALLLTAMIAGLLRQRRARSFGVWKMLCQQGWVWIALAIVAEVPTLVLVLLNISPSFNLLLQKPRVVIASIGTTTMFRMLHDFPGRREAEMPINILRYRPDSTSGLASSSTNSQLKVSVDTNTVSFWDENTQKEEFE